MGSLWGEAFTLPSTKEVVAKALDSDKKKAVGKKQQLSIQDQLELIKKKVYEILGTYVTNTITLRTRESLHAYIDAALSNKVIAIDTETNHSLDPLTCVLMGGCIYTPGQKNAYIPVNHVDPESKIRLENQVTEKDIAEEFSRLDGIEIVTHNGKFDYQVLKCTTGWEMPLTWDTLIGSKVLNTVEKAGLKYQYITKVDPTIEKYSIDTFFEDIPYEFVDPDLFALYAATDAYMTYELYKFQKKRLELTENAGLLKVFKSVEMPVVIPIAEMELNGVSIDAEYVKRLSAKYHKKLDDIDAKISTALSSYTNLIQQWRLTPEANHKEKVEETRVKKSKSEQLSDPVNLSSPIQLAILLYDILKVKVVDKNNPRGTGEDILAKIDLPLCKLITERRVVKKLLSTYIDKITECLNPKDGKVHTHFNQYGAETGRLSSSDPINLQNIPSHEKSIRLMFTASPGYVMLGSDFSSQEPRLLATYAQDHNMQHAFLENKDLYATVAEKVYNNSYEDNLQTHADGSPFPEGKERRSNCKSLLLGIMYGRGVASIAEQIGKSTEEAQDILDKFYKDFPSVKEWTEQTQLNAHKNGYVEDLWGRRRNLPNIQLPPYELSLKEDVSVKNFNPLLGSTGTVSKDKPQIIQHYEALLKDVRSKKDSDRIKEQALQDGVIIKNNLGFIAEAERQSINARIQGGAASMSKKAMTALYRDPEMRKLGFRLLIMVHDELIGECPIENQDKALARLSYLMSESGKPEVDLPMKCDAVPFSHWYLDEYSDMLNEEYDKLKSNNLEDSDILKRLYEEHCESTPEDIRSILKDKLKSSSFSTANVL